MLPAIHDAKLAWLYGGVLFLLVVSTLIGRWLKRRRKGEAGRGTIENVNARIRAWWKMCAIFALAILVGRHHQLAGVHHRRARSFRLWSPGAVPLQTDGDPAGWLPATVEVMPQKLTLVVPDRRLVV